MADLAVLLSGALIGVLLGTFGGGGSILAAPLLLYVGGVADTHRALGTAAAAVALIAAFGLWRQARAGRVKWPCALVFGAAGLVGALLGARLALKVDGKVLLLAFAGAMALVGLSMLRTARGTGDAHVTLGSANALRLVPVGGAVGAASGFFGIGGGFLIVPGLMFAAGMTMLHASAASLLSVAVFGTATAATYAQAGLVDGRLVALLIVGGAAGSLIGVRAARLLGERQRAARIAFALAIVAVAALVGADAASALR